MEIAEITLLALVANIVLTVVGWRVVYRQQQIIAQQNQSLERDKIVYPRKISQVEELITWANKGLMLVVETQSVVRVMLALAEDKKGPSIEDIKFLAKKTQELDTLKSDWLEKYSMHAVIVGNLDLGKENDRQNVAKLFGDFYDYVAEASDREKDPAQSTQVIAEISKMYASLASELYKLTL